MVRIPTHREPTHPGEMLIEEFLTPMGITQKDLADSIHVPYQRINEIINKKRGITPSTALRLAKFFGVSEDFWMNLQLRCDLYKTKQTEEKTLNDIKPFNNKSNQRKNKNITPRIRLDCESGASHNLNRLLDKPGHIL
jgi:addiction module HigA family antidote